MSTPSKVKEGSKENARNDLVEKQFGLVEQ